jgi:thiamine pyrophosphate-dependent acetolactate synthase large subunit-like protein
MTRQTSLRDGVAAGLRAPQYGSDIVVDMLHALDIDYVVYNPGATFKWIQDSIVNYGGDSKPRSIMVCHEEIGVSMAQGYARAALKPLATAIHDLVGLQHASMGIFNAWCDRNPVLMLGGTGPLDLTTRRPWIDWIHTSSDQAGMIRDYTKWDDQPHTHAAIPESMLRAYRVAMTEPMGPVYVNFDAGLQESSLAAPIELPAPAQYTMPSRLQVDLDGIERLAGWLIAAEGPLIIADYVGRHPDGFRALAELADLVAIPVVDKFQRHNISTAHPMDVTGAGQSVIESADLILALDSADIFGALNARHAGDRKSYPLYKSGTRLASISLGDLGIRAWAHNYQRMQPLDLDLYGDTALALPQLVQRCRALIERDDSARRRIASRHSRIAAQHDAIRASFREQAAAKWANSPVSSPRLIVEVAQALRGRKLHVSGWHFEGLLRGLMEFEEFNQFNGVLGGGGQGGYFGHGIGAALALNGTDRFPLLIQSDGDALYTPSALWTAAHEKIPLLTIMYNNRSYYNSQAHAAGVARDRNRQVERSVIGCALTDPNVDFAMMARSFGVHAEGPIVDPEDLAPALRRAIAIVDQGEPALVDVVCEYR